MKRKKPSSKSWKIGQVKHFPFDDRHRVPFELPDGVENPTRFSARLNVRTVTYFCDFVLAGLTWRTKFSISREKVLDWAREKEATK